jgi:hypothetical protein
VLALYAELDAQADQLRQATELKSRFLAYMSHEFRTPINSIRSITRLLLDRVDGPLTEEQEKQVTFIQQNATEFAEMVDDLLDLAKVEAGRVEISPAWFEMVDLFSALRGMFKPVLTNPAVNLVFEEPQDVPQALHRRPQAVADPAQLHLQRAEVHAQGRGARGRPARRAMATRDLLGGRHRHRHRARIPPHHLPGLLAGAVAAAEAPARHRPGPVAEQEAGGAAGRQRGPAERTGQGLGLFRDDPGAAGGRRAGMIDVRRHQHHDRPLAHTVLVVDDNPPRAIPPRA